MERSDFVVDPESWQGHPSEDGEPEFPFLRDDTSPDGAYVAMQWPTAEPSGAIWDTKTRRIAYRPRGGVAFRWIAGGSRLLLVRETYLLSPRQTTRPSPLQQDYGYSLELLTWPQHVSRSRIGVTLPIGWPNGVVTSPDERRIAVGWNDQGECGCVFFRRDGDQLLPDPVMGKGLFVPGFNASTRSVFSANGDWLAVGVSITDAWWNDVAWDEDSPALGGPRLCGFVVLCDCRHGGSSLPLPIVAETEAGWLPQTDPISGLNEAQFFFVGTPFFPDMQTVAVPLGNGVTWTHALPEAIREKPSVHDFEAEWDHFKLSTGESNFAQSASVSERGGVQGVV